MLNVHTAHQTTSSITVERFLYLCKNISGESHYQQLIQMLKEMSSAEAHSIIHAENDEAFYYAAWYGYAEVIKLLLEFTPNTDLRNKIIHAKNDKVFRDAAEKGHIEVIKLLLEFIPDPELRNNMIHVNNDQVFSYAAKDARTEVIKLLLELTPDPQLRSKMIHAENDKAFWFAVINNRIEVMKLLLELTPDPQPRSKMIHSKDDKVFSDAARYGYAEVIKLLLELSPDPQLRSKMIHAENDKAFSDAAWWFSHIEVIKLLLEFTPDPELRSKMIHANNDKAFCSAARKGHIEVIKLLLEFTPDLELRNNMIHTNNDQEFCNAAKEGHVEVIKLLLEFTPDPELRSKMIHANNDEAFKKIVAPMEAVRGDYMAYLSGWQYPKLPQMILRDGKQNFIKIFLELETDYFVNLARSLTLTPGTVKFIAETSQNIRAASSNAIVAYVSEIKFDNIIFAHPQLLLEAWKMSGKSSVNNLIDLGQDKEAAETIIDALNTYGAKHVVEIIFGSNNIHSNIKYEQPNEKTLAVVEKTQQKHEFNQDAVISNNLILSSFAAKEAIEILPTIKYFVKEVLKIQYELPEFVDNNYFKLIAHFIACNIGAFAVTGKLDITSASLPTAIYGGRILTYEYLTHQKQLNFKNTEDKSIDNSIEFIQKCGFDIATQTAFGIVTSVMFGSSSMMYDVAISATIGGMQCYDLYNSVNSSSDQSIVIIPYIIDATVLYGATKNMNFDFNTQIGQMFAIKQVSVALSSVVITDYMTKLLLANMPETCSNYLSNIAGDIYSYFDIDSIL